MGNKITYFIIAIAVIIEFLTVKSWFVCKSFTDLFYLSSVNIPLQIEGSVHMEKGTPLLLTRLFTNKITDTFLDLFRTYMQFWDIRFGISWFSPVCYFGIFAGFYYILSNKKKKAYHWAMLVVILLLPLIEVLKEPHISILLKSLYLWVPYLFFSLYGIYQFLTHGNKKWKLVVIIILVLLSIWWIFFLPYTLSRYCIV